MGMDPLAAINYRLATGGLRKAGPRGRLIWGEGDVRKLGLIAAAALLAAGPASAESDWINNILKKPDATSTSDAAGRPRKGAFPLPGKAGDADRTRPDRASSSLTSKEQKEKKRKENQFVRPDLPPASGPWQWKVMKTAWAAEDETGFEQFLLAIGESECSTVHECLTSPVANPRYHGTNPPYTKFSADCADLPYVLRGYYAWKNSLPFSFSVKYSAHSRQPGNKTSVLGNQIVDRFDIVGPGPDGRRALPAISQFVSSEHFRTPPQYTGQRPNDFYPVKLTRESIRPGTVIFDPDGHIAVVYKVSDNGLIHYIDAHPDNSLTRGVYGREFARAVPQMGAGFKRWRPQELKGASKLSDGSYSGGNIVLKPDAELADWSDEQYYGNSTPHAADWTKGKFEVNGIEADYYDYLRLRLAYPGFKYDLIEETRVRVRGLCDDLKERVASVNNAVKGGIHRKPPPSRLPHNIYATTGEWETYSTPSRDARLKAAFEELRDETARFIRMSRSENTLLEYKGTDLRADLRTVYDAEAASCNVTYTRTDGSLHSLAFKEVARRLFRLSFDPYHCVELRWGASAPSELKTCTDSADKRAWYEAQDRLRNQLTRTYGEPMGWGLAQLQNRSLDIGIDEVPDIDMEKVLNGNVDDDDTVAEAAPAPRSRRGAVAARQERGRLVVPARHRP